MGFRVWGPKDRQKVREEKKVSGLLVLLYCRRRFGQLSKFVSPFSIRMPHYIGDLKRDPSLEKDPPETSS